MPNAFKHSSSRSHFFKGLSNVSMPNVTFDVVFGQALYESGISKSY